MCFIDDYNLFHQVVSYGILVLAVSIVFAYFIVSGRLIGKAYKQLDIPPAHIGDDSDNYKYFCDKLDELKIACEYGECEHDEELIQFLKGVKYLGRDIAILNNDGEIEMKV